MEAPYIETAPIIGNHQTHKSNGKHSSEAEGVAYQLLEGVAFISTARERAEVSGVAVCSLCVLLLAYSVQPRHSLVICGTLGASHARTSTMRKKNGRDHKQIPE